MSRYITKSLPRYRQGDILRDVVIVEWADAMDDTIEIRQVELAYCVVLSQDCDLEHDFNNRQALVVATPMTGKQPNNDKYLQSLLLCPAYPAQSLREGTHLSERKLTMGRISTDEWRKVCQNNVYRYHYLGKSDEQQVPELILDFKHYFTVPRDIAYRPEFKDRYLATHGRFISGAPFPAFCQLP